ncbi:MAG: permease-like cell division protein FtsX [Candidatus Nanoperiomorbaceae bacterium]
MMAPVKKSVTPKSVSRVASAKSRAKTVRRKPRLDAGREHARHILNRRRVVRYGLRNIVRNAWLTIAATLVMAITLLIIFAMLVASLVLNETITDQRAKMDMSIYLKSATSDDTLANLVGKLRVLPNVAKATYSNSTAQYNQIRQDPTTDTSALELAAQNGVSLNPPALIVVKFRDPNDTTSVRKLMTTDPQFSNALDPSQNSADSTKIQQTTVNRLSSIMDSVQRVGLIAVLIFVAISVLIVFNTIRMAIFSRREEIDMMKVIGADRSFIRGPFLVEAELYGVIAAAVALAIGYFAIGKILPALDAYASASVTQDIMGRWAWLIIIGLVVIGMLIGGLSSRLAVRRYLKE